MDRHVLFFNLANVRTVAQQKRSVQSETNERRYHRGLLRRDSSEFADHVVVKDRSRSYADLLHRDIEECDLVAYRRCSAQSLTESEEKAAGSQVIH